jgi:dihydrofolate reductase
MVISLIVAMDQNRGIGHHNRIPWRLSADLKHFKALTMGHCLVMGRKTYESIGNALPGRTIIVVSHQPGEALRLPQGCLAARSLEEALSIADRHRDSEVFVIGGGEIYHHALPLADRIYLTRVEAEVEADTYFPEIHAAEWQGKEILRCEADDKNQFGFVIEQLDRVRGSIGSAV